MTFNDALPKKLITLFVPSKDKYNYTISQHHYWTMKAVKMLSSLYGGATAHSATGGWINDAHYIVTEEVSVVQTYASLEAFENIHNQELVIYFCKNMGRILNQNEVALVVDGKYLEIRDFDEYSDDEQGD